MNSWAKSIFVGAAASMMGAWLFVGAYVAWIIHKTQGITGPGEASAGVGVATATSWDLRSLGLTVASPQFVGVFLVTVVAFFGLGVWLDCRFLRTNSVHR